MELLAIGEVARLSGLRPSALRYYEGLGLLPAAERRGGKRYYAGDALKRLALITAARGLGFTIADLQALFDGIKKGAPTGRAWREAAQAKLREVEAIIRRAETVRRILQESLRCDCLSLDDCEIL